MWTANRKLIRWLFVFCAFFWSHTFFAQASLDYHSEIVLGHIVPNYQDYPSSGLLHGIGIGIQSTNIEDKIWHKNFPNAETGIYVGYWKMGNDSIFGSELAAYPYVHFPLGKLRKNPLHMRIGIGAAHFSKHYTIDQNVHNIAVGSRYTWAFEASLFWKKSLSEHLDFSLSGKYLHGSNGHTQLPNFGINSAALGVGLHYSPAGKQKTPPISLERSKAHFFQVKAGIGLHEFGGTNGPVNGPKYGVYSLAFYRNIQYNHRNRLKLGLNLRQYNSYSTYIVNHPDLKESITPYSVSFALGHEFLFGHIGLDVDGLLHLYKPFYRVYFDEFGPDGKIIFLIHRWLGARIGLNAYLLPPSQNPKNNIFMGIHLNTNNGEADFSSITIGLDRFIR